MSLRAVFDTNTVVSALLFQGGQLGWLRGVWAGNRMTPLVSRHTVEELVRVLAYPKLDLSPDDRNEILGEYLPHAETLKEPIAPPDLPPCRDPDDRKFLILAAAARVDTLVTGDRDLLDLRGPAPVPILTPAELRRKLATCAKGKGREGKRYERVGALSDSGLKGGEGFRPITNHQSRFPRIIECPPGLPCATGPGAAASAWEGTVRWT